MRDEAERMVDEMIDQFAEVAEEDGDLFIAMVERARKRLEGHIVAIRGDLARKESAG